MISLENKSIMVVGGGRGIGSAIVTALAQAGVKTWIVDTDQTSNSVNHYQSQEINGYNEACALADGLNAQGFSCRAYKLDATQENDVVTAVNEIVGQSDNFYGVVNALGSTNVCYAVDTQLNDFNALLQTNLIAPYLVSREVAKKLIAADTGGAILNISSISGKVAFPSISAYCAAKSGLQGFTTSLALEVAKHNIRVNCICPGIVKTNMWKYLENALASEGQSNDEFWAEMLAMIPLGRTQSQDNIAQLCLSMLSNEDITGQSFSIDGGMNRYV